MSAKMFFSEKEVKSNMVEIDNVFAYLDAHFPNNQITTWGSYKEKCENPELLKANAKMWDDYFFDKEKEQIVAAEEMWQRFGVFCTDLNNYIVA